MIVPWDSIDYALLDMDGTLLDRYFDDYFWEEYVPQKYATKNGISYEKSRKKLLAMYKKEEQTLNWTDLYYWSKRLELDIVGLKEDIRGQVRIHPGVISFLHFLRDTGKEVILITNAHPKTVQIKMEQTLLLPYFHTILCSSDVGLPKEEIGFWREAEKVLEFDRNRSLFVDDNENVLSAAHAFGIKYVLHKNGGNSHFSEESSDMFEPVRHFADLIPK